MKDQARQLIQLSYYLMLLLSSCFAYSDRDALCRPLQALDELDCNRDVFILGNDSSAKSRFACLVRSSDTNKSCDFTSCESA
jgi:hypothetical protein